MKNLVISLLLSSITFTGCGRKKDLDPIPTNKYKVRVPRQRSDNPNQDQPTPEIPLPQSMMCKYRYESAPEGEQWDNLRNFIGVWISKKRELTEKIKRNGEVVYVRNGLNVESEISFRPILFIYTDENGKNLLAIDSSPAHSIKMSRQKFGDFFLLQSFHDLRPKREKCTTFGIRLLNGGNTLEVLGPEIGDSLSDPLPAQDFFDMGPESEKYEIYENRESLP